MKALKNIIITHAVFLALFAGAGLALAQESGTDVSAPSNDFETREQMEAKRLEMQEKATERQAQMETKRVEAEERATERRTVLQARAQERITNLAANISNRMEAAIARIQNIINRMDSRMNKLSERGVDITTAKISLDSAQTSLDAAISKIATIDKDVAAAVGSEDARVNWAPVKAKYMEIRDDIKAAHTELRASLEALKTALAEAEINQGVSDAVRNNPETETEEVVN